MPTPKKSMAALIASGAVAKNPKRFVEDPHTPPSPKSPLGYAPKHLTTEQKKVWKEIVSSMPEGLLGSCDGIVLELALNLVIKMRTRSDEWKSVDATTLANIMGKLGGTPGDRQRLNVTAPAEKKADDPWDSL